MTIQVPETLYYQGEKVAMGETPLWVYFEMGGVRPRFEKSCTALRRGYIGTWEIVGDRLYLIGLTARLEDGTNATLETIFPGFPDRVFAHWYSGTIQLPQGEEIVDIDMADRSIFERYLLLDIDRGVLVATRVRHSEVDKEDDPVP